jgi:uncharacterized protein (TIGR03437 family)
MSMRPRGLPITLALAVLAGMASAQQVPVAVQMVNAPGFGDGCCGSESGEVSGSLSPFTGTFQLSFYVLGATMTFTITDSAGDQLQFVDAAASTHAAIGGTARLIFGTGAFNGAKGMLTYGITCVVTVPGVSCVDKDGAPLSAVQTINMSLNGTLYLPPTATALLPTAPSPPPANSDLASYHSGTNTGVLNSIWQFLQSAAPPQAMDNSPDAARADSAGAATSLAITVPWQPIATTYNVTATCPGSGGCWVSVPQATGSIPAFSSVPITMNLNPPITNAGVFPANVAVTLAPSTPGGDAPAPATLNLPMNAIVTSAGPMLALSQTGLQFELVSGQATPAPQTVAISNQGTGSMPFSVTASTLSGGSWLAVAQPSGEVDSQASTPMSIQVNPAGLGPGTYFGRVDVASPGALAAPQSVEVVLTVLPSTANPAPLISPSGLIFIAAARSNPAPQSVQLFNPSNQTLVVSPNAPPKGWFTVASSGGGSIGPSQTLTETVSVNTAGFGPGVYKATLNLEEAATGAAFPIPVLLLVTPAAACTPTQLLPLITNLVDGFQATAGLPVAIQAQIVDDCGTPLTAGSVVASFSEGDPPVSLTSSGNGTWSGTWMPGILAGGASGVTVTANSFTPALRGSSGISGTLAPNATVPAVNVAGVVSAASLAPNAPIAPGSFISIFGSNLGSAPTYARSLPLPTTLGQTQVLLGGQALPLNFVGPGQINAIVPNGTPTNTLQQLMVIQNGMYSLPASLVVAESQPAVFTQNQTGKGAGVIMVEKADGTQSLNTSSSPASAGDNLTIYCSGLGAVKPAVPDGMAGASSPLSNTVNPVTVTLGGQPAQVSYSGLAPGFAGLYQVNVVVPSGLTPAPNVPLVLSVAGQQSPPVTLAVQ